MLKALTEVDKQYKEMLTKYRKEMALRKKLHNELVDIKGNIRVFARIRPIIREDGDGPDAKMTIKADPRDNELCIYSDPKTKKDTTLVPTPPLIFTHTLIDRPSRTSLLKALVRIRFFPPVVHPHPYTRRTYVHNLRKKNICTDSISRALLALSRRKWMCLKKPRISCCLSLTGTTSVSLPMGKLVRLLLIYLYHERARAVCCHLSPTRFSYSQPPKSSLVLPFRLG